MTVAALLRVPHAAGTPGEIIDFWPGFVTSGGKTGQAYDFEEELVDEPGAPAGATARSVSRARVRRIW